MNLFKSMCMAAAMGLLLTPALGQRSRGGGDDKSGGGGVQSGPTRGGGQDRTSSPVQPPVAPPVQRGNDDRGRGNNDRPSPPVTPPIQRGNDDRGRGNNDRSNPPVQNGGGSRDRNDKSDPPARDNGGGRTVIDPPVRTGGGHDRGGSNQGGPVRGGGTDRTHGNPPVRSGGGTDRSTQDPPTRTSGGTDRNSGNPPVRTGGGTTRGGTDRSGGWPSQGTSRTGGVKPSRIDVSTSSELLKPKSDARSGRSSYGVNSNVSNRRRESPVSITRIGGTTILDLRGKVRRSENISLNIGGVRVNYYHYNSNWCDDYFYYPYYYSNPYGYHCVVSPWYYYPCLPAYVSYDRCRFYSYGPWNTGWSGSAYNWNRPSYYGNGNYYNNDGYSNYRRGTYTDLDYAVDDIVNSFEQMDRRAIGRLVPQSGDVAIYVDGNYSYSLNGDDFYDMFTDAVENTKTTRYVITNVQTNRDSARVTARHEYEDPWGRQTSVYHYYELKNDRHNMVITRFGVSNDGRW